MRNAPVLVGPPILVTLAARMPLAAPSITQLRVGYPSYAPGAAPPIAIGHNATIEVIGPGIGAVRRTTS
jgi:hypothetical protein